MHRAAIALLLLLFGSFAAAAFAAAPIVRDLPPGLQVPAAAQPGPGFDVDRATDAYLDLLSPEQRALSDRYFEGGYWLQLWDLLYMIAICALLQVTGVSRRVSDWTTRISRRLWLSTALYMVLLSLALSLLTLPLSIYQDFAREHQYGLSEQSFGSWLRDQAVALPVNMILEGVLLTALYAAVRRTGDAWWMWATGITSGFLLALQLIFPVFIAPLFNDYKPLPAGPVREAVLSLARANGIPTQHVDWFNGSKQTTRVSANVAGLLGTTRINLNDNLLNKTSQPEIRAILGHEMGHYVLNHAWKGAMELSLAVGLAFGLMHLASNRVLAAWGGRMQIRDRADPAGAPAAIALVSVIFLLLTPLNNTIIRNMEAEADAFGLNAAREPQAFALSAIRLSSYRKLKPGALEEIVFYDHPSGYARVHASMVWLKENPTAVSIPDASTVPVAPAAPAADPPVH